MATGRDADCVGVVAMPRLHALDARRRHSPPERVERVQKRIQEAKGWKD